MITAWQISSTLTNMEEFIKFIQNYQSQIQKLELILPHVCQIRKIQENKQILNRQYKSLVAQIGSYTGKNQINQKKLKLTQEKAAQQKITQGKIIQQKIIQGKVTQKNKLNDIVDVLINQNIRNSKKLKQINSKFIKNKQSQKEQRQDRRKHFQDKIKLIVNENKKQTECQIKNQRNKYLIQQCQSIYSQFLNQLFEQRLDLKQMKKQTNPQTIKYSALKPQQIYPSVKPQQIQEFNKMKQFQQHQQFSNIVSSFDSLIQSFYMDLGQIKCKLLSLQDKKRKITIQNLLKHRHNKLSQEDNCNFIWNGQTKINNNKTQLNSKKDSKAYFSIFTLFSPKETPQKIDINNKEQTYISQNQAQVIKGIKLSIFELKAQILQTTQHLQIGLLNNIFNQIIVYTSNIRQINIQIRSYINQIIQIIDIIAQSKSQQKLNASGNQNHNSQQFKDHTQLLKGNAQLLRNNTQPLKGNCQKQKQKQELLQKDKNVIFFLNIIKQKLQKRTSLLRKLLLQTCFSVQTFTQYLINKISSIKSSANELHEQIKNYQQISSTTFTEVKYLFGKTELQLNYLRDQTNQLMQTKINPLINLFKQTVSQYLTFSHSLNQVKNKFSQLKHQSKIIRKDNFQREQPISEQTRTTQNCDYQLKLSYQVECVKKIVTKTFKNQQKSNLQQYQIQHKNNQQTAVFHFYELFVQGVFNSLTANPQNSQSK